MKQVFDAGLGRSRAGRTYNFCPNCGSKLTPAASPGDRQRCERCHFTIFVNPSPGVVVLVVREGKILLGKRAEPGFRAGHWCLPGGFLEFGEHFLAAAHREILEETGIKVEIQSILNVVSNFLSERLETLVIVLLANYSSGNIRPGDDLAELSWFSLDEALPTMAFEADEYIIHQYASGHKTGLPVDPRYRKSV